MTGLEKMISQIIDEATESANSLTAKAQEEAAEITTAAAAEAEKQKEEISRKSEADVATYMDRVKSSADLQRRTAILKAKQEVIAEVLAKAYTSVEGLDDKAYFDMIRKMLEKYAKAGDGEIYFSAKDLGRMSDSFKEEIVAIAAKKGGSLKLAGENKSIENGFILVYGGVEENCTFRALFNTQKDRLQDIVHQKLFL